LSLSFEKFLAWAEQRFGDVVVKGNEIKINSIFDPDDYKHHMWCNPYGGKKGEDRPHGVYHCWKTGRKGTLVSLVMDVEHVPYEEALDILDGNPPMSEVEKEIERMFDSKQAQVISIPEKGIDLPPGTFRIRDLPEDNYYRISAEAVLASRKLPVDDLMVCTQSPPTKDEPDYNNRLIIPYHDRSGKLVYFNARYLGKDKDVVRYLGPPKEIGIGKGDVVYMPSWPEPGTKVYLTEGELDARSLIVAGLDAGAFGSKILTENQAAILRGYLPCLCLDNDKAGKVALPQIGDYFLSQGFKAFSYVRPPKMYKDWNEMLQKAGPRLLRGYVLSNEKVYDDDTSLLREMDF
jgi:DNA primase